MTQNGITAQWLLPSCLIVVTFTSTYRLAFWVLAIADNMLHKTSPNETGHGAFKRQCRHRASMWDVGTACEHHNRFDANTDFVALEANDLRLDENMLVYLVFFCFMILR